MSYYCNTYGQSVQNEKCMDCAQRYGGHNCPCIGDGFFGTLQNDTGTYEGWYCGSITPGGGPTNADKVLTKGDLKNRGRGGEVMNTVTLSESELVNLIKGVINETDATTITPNFKVDKGRLDIDGKKYKLESEKAWIRIGIDIVKVSTDDDGLSLTVEHPISGKLMTNKIRQKNVDKVVNGAANNEDEITVKNLEGKEFYLVRV